MKLLKMARELITITEYLRDKYGIYYAEGNLFDFDELWRSTALGFGGVGRMCLSQKGLKKRMCFLEIGFRIKQL